jgi:CheY-specific phosphatase CheX
MHTTDSPNKGYVLVALFGAIAGGIIVMLATKAIPKMMSRMMAEMMSGMQQKMIAQMGEGGCDPRQM